MNHDLKVQSKDKRPSLQRITEVIPRHILLICGIFMLSWAVLLLGRWTVAETVEAYQTVIPPQPFFVLDHLFQFYLTTPLVILSSLLVYLLPGFFLAISLNESTSWGSLVLQSFGLAFGLYLLVTTLIKTFLPGEVSGSIFIGGQLVSGLLTLSFSVWRGLRVRGRFAGFERSQLNRRVLLTLIIPIILLLLLFPFFFWQDMHDDGFEVLEIGRSLFQYTLPRFPNPRGVQGLGQGMLAMAYPAHWFITVFGPLEVSARLPFLLYLPVLFLCLVQLIELNSSRRMGFREEALLLLGLAVFSVTMVFNSSYDPYFADIAAPAALETMTILSIAGAIYFLLTERMGWFLGFATLSFLTRPTALMVIGMVGLLTPLVFPTKARRWLPWIGGAVAGYFAMAFLYDGVYAPSIAAGRDLGYAAGGILNRIRYIRWVEPSRINFALFPSGILPFLSLFLIPWQDRFSRLLSILTLGYFLFFFFQGFVALHHFVPVMVLPLVVFWRMALRLETGQRRWVYPLVLLLGGLALYLSLPQHFQINRTVRPIGIKTEIRIGNYESDYREIIEHEEIFFALIPPDWEVEDRSQELVTGATSLIYYASQPKPPGVEINYVVQYAGDNPPEGFTKAAEEGGAVLYVMDQEEWSRDRYQDLRTDFQSPLYQIRRTTLFNFRGVPEDQILIDARRVGGDLLRAIMKMFRGDQARGFDRLLSISIDGPGKSCS